MVRSTSQTASGRARARLGMSLSILYVPRFILTLPFTPS